MKKVYYITFNFYYTTLECIPYTYAEQITEVAFFSFKILLNREVNSEHLRSLESSITWYQFLDNHVR